MASTQLNEKIDLLPDPLKKQVDDFVDFLLAKSKKAAVKKPRFGSAKGFFKMAEDFDAPLEDFKEYME